MLSSYPLVDEKTIPRSFQPGNLIHIKKQYPSRRICLLLDDVTYVDHLTEVEKLEYKIAREKLPENIEEIIKICGGYKPEYISVRFNMLTDEFVSLMQKEGVRLDIYTLNDLDDLKCQLPEGVVTDRPENILDK
jgi:glycerophosphoryl diester phosphodiesterase